MNKKITSSDVEYDPFADEHQLLKVVASTEPQREIWTSVQMSENASCAFNESITLEFTGTVNKPALITALRYLIQRHESLRTTFNSDGTSLCIAESSELALTELTGDKSDFRRIVQAEANSAFDLENGPLLRFTIIDNIDQSWLILSAHHIICDGWSLAILVNDLSAAYNSALQEKDVTLPPAFPYSQYARENAELVSKSDDENYWMNLYSDPLAVHDLPAEFERPAFRTFDADRLDFELDNELVAGIKKLAGKQGVSLTALMLAAFYTCLYKWSGDRDLVIGLPAASQPQYDPESLVGHCVNFLPLRMQLDAQQSFSDLLSNVSNLILDAYEHQNFTYGSLLKKLPIKREPSRIPLCPVSFNVDQGIQGSKLNFQGLDVQFHSNPRNYENFEIFINASDYGDKFIIECQYNTNLFSEGAIRNRLEEYRLVLSQLVENIGLSITEIQLLSEQQQITQLQKHSNAQSTEPCLTLVELFEHQALLTPDTDAVICENKILKYKELQAQSNKLASVLIEQGVTPGSLVGICLDRSIDLLTVLLGVLKTGAGYVPLDPEYPVDRLNYMLKDAGLHYLISQEEHANRLKEIDHCFLLDKLLADSVDKPAELPQIKIPGNAICYVIYTSGSTGKPKGVLVPHSSVSNFLQSMKEKPGITDSDSLLAVTTLSFDIAVLELYLPLISCAKVVIATREHVVDGNKLKQQISDNGITIMQATPATWRLLYDSNWHGDDRFKILCGGEALPQDLRSELLKRSAELWNMYGPTETTVWSTCQLINNDNGAPLIGKAIANTNLYVLDEYHNILPDGISGELYIGGEGVTQGYLNREKLTRERFINLAIADNKLVYKTGDRVRFGADGNLEYLGRLDNQVKLRGFRIELGEIESAIRQHDTITDCALSIQTISQGDERLIAYIVTPETTFDSKQIRDFLAQSLPEYMIPLHFMQLTSLPCTPNGKLDRNALPQYDFSTSRQSITGEANTQTEHSLVTIWQDTLKVNSIGSEDNFFDLGGHSLLITKIIQKVEQQLNVQLEYRDVFDNPTVRSLAAYIDSHSEQHNDQQTSQIRPRENRQQGALSPAQQRIWYLEKMDPGATHFNLPSAFKFTGELDIPALEKAFQQMIDRHETLRTSIYEDDDSPLQFIHEHIDFSLPVSKIENTEQPEKQLAQRLHALQNHNIDISTAPLFRAELIRLNDTEHVLFFMPHHMMFDGWSFDLFVHEITTLYSSNIGVSVGDLEKLDFQYADYASWLRELLSSEAFQTQADFWKNLLQGTLPILQIPEDFARPTIAKNTGAELHFEIDETLIHSLNTLVRSKDVSMFMLLMSSYLCLLHKYTGQTDLIVGAPMADRSRPGTENLIGFFVNALVLRFNINPEQSFSELLEQVKEVCLSGFAHQDVPFETLVEQLNPERDLSRAPLFQTSLTYQDVSAREETMGDIEIQQVEIPTTESPLDLNIWFKRKGEKMTGAVVYNTELFHADTMKRFVKHFQNILSNVSRSWHQSINDLQITSTAEKQHLIKLNNNTETKWANVHLIHHLFEDQVEKTPDNIAAIFENNQSTYRQLSTRSTQLAHHLIDNGVEPGQMIGLCTDRSADMLVSLLAILKTGCCYIPLDPEFPPERLSYMVKDAGIQWLITQQKYTSTVPGVKNTILIDDLDALLENVSTDKVEINTGADSLAYVIYTSGSTGNPKGVMVPHSAVINFLLGMSQRPGIDASDKLLAVTTLSFDIAVLELYLPLITGATTIIASKQDVINGNSLKNLIAEHQISIMQATPATWRLLISAGWDPEQGNSHSIKALCGGEVLPTDLADDLLTRVNTLWNMYGPTETTVWSSCCQVKSSEQPLSIGTPITNTQFYILDKTLNPVTIGVAGELHISGAGVSKGYLNNPDMTAERFIDNPFTHKGKLYKTGDRVRYRYDGSLEYLSRIDHQVKVRGYRIELGEIESVLRTHDSIQDCVVSVVEERKGDARLVAYIVWAAEPLTMTELRTFCKDWLPAYMIPQHTIEISTIPKTPNGKIDRKQLPALFSNMNQNDSFIAPDTEQQVWLADHWKQVIGTDKVGKHDNFFELGGHSLLSMQIIHKIEKRYNVVVNPRDLLLDTLEQVALQFSGTTQADPEEKKNTGLFGRLLNKIKN